MSYRLFLLLWFVLEHGTFVPSPKFEIPSFFSQIDTLGVASFSSQLPNPIPFNLEPFYDANVWITIEKTKRKWKDYELNKVFQDV
jgi:hypothetical protein